MHCLDCGVEFPVGTSKNRVRCDECKRQHRRTLDRERYKQRMLDDKLKVREERAPTNSLAEVARAAIQAGMSYGQYVSRYRV